MSPLVTPPELRETYIESFLHEIREKYDFIAHWSYKYDPETGTIYVEARSVSLARTWKIGAHYDERSPITTALTTLAKKLDSRMAMVREEIATEIAALREEVADA